MNPAPVGRFAPTPSGRMHLGNVLCMLLAWLSARSQGGSVILRIEDIDYPRLMKEGAALMESDLRWLGLDWDEGGSLGGPHAPYYQRMRGELYAEAFHKLEKAGLLYPCFCSRAQLHSVNAPHLSDGVFVYAGTCRALSQEEVERRRRERTPAIRLRVPEEVISFQDGHYGLVEENLARECGDFIVRRADGLYPYQLAVVVDDGLMGVTQVVRGRDLLSSTPRQLYLYRLLGLTPPTFCHLPLLLDSEGRRLSKRDRDLDLGLLRERFTPQWLLGQLAWLCGLLDRPEPASARDLLPLFSWEKIPKEDLRLPAAFLS